MEEKKKKGSDKNGVATKEFVLYRLFQLFHNHPKRRQNVDKLRLFLFLGILKKSQLTRIKVMCVAHTFLWKIYFSLTNAWFDINCIKNAWFDIICIYAWKFDRFSSKHVMARLVWMILLQSILESTLSLTVFWHCLPLQVVPSTSILLFGPIYIMPVNIYKKNSCRERN